MEFIFLTSVADPHWFQCEAISWSDFSVTKSWILTWKIYLGNYKGNISIDIPYDTVRTRRYKSHFEGLEIRSFVTTGQYRILAPGTGSAFPIPIWIQIQEIKTNGDPCGSAETPIFTFKLKGLHTCVRRRSAKCFRILSSCKWKKFNKGLDNF